MYKRSVLLVVWLHKTRVHETIDVLLDELLHTIGNI
jgi:hypothetical protein